MKISISRFVLPIFFLSVLCSSYELSTAQTVKAEVTIKGEKPSMEANKLAEPVLKFSDPQQRMHNGNGTVSMTGEMKQWHKITLTLDGPFAHELDTDPNPFTDYRMEVTFRHESGSPVYKIPGYFAADGNAGETSSDSGIKWRAHLSPDKTGKWSYTVQFLQGRLVAVADVPWSKTVGPYNGISGSFEIYPTDKTGRDFRGKGRLEYVGKHHLLFRGNNEYFLKAGADSPETFLAYSGFDGTYTMQRNTPLKNYESHIKDWKEGDPTWKGGQGKGIIGAVNYLSGKGVNAISFLTYNAGGDGDNVWPFVKRNEKFHYDCSKLDQWQTLFDHAQAKGMYLHFKTQETENDDNNRRPPKEGSGKTDNMTRVIESLDGGDLGPERILYYRELIARYSYLLALNFNFGEENTQTTDQHQAMAEYFHKYCPYPHNIVLHTFPNQQELVYTPLLGKKSELTGLSLQNGWDQTHKWTLRWVKESDEAGKAWVVANDEQGSASQGVPPDPGFKGWDTARIDYSIQDIRKQTLWGNIMAGGAGVEYYFGYNFPDNDLNMEDFRSRDKSWDYCRIALDFFKTNNIPFWEMKNMNHLIGNTENNKEKYCFAKEGEVYLVYLAYVSSSTLDLRGTNSSFSISWFNPEIGGSMLKGKLRNVKGGKLIDLGLPPKASTSDWVVLLRKQ